MSEKDRSPRGISLKRLANIVVGTVDKKTYPGQRIVQQCNYVDVYYHDLILENMDFDLASASDEEVSKFTPAGGDVVLTKDSESAQDIGISAYVPETLPGVVYGYHLAILKPLRWTNGKYLKYVFDSWDVKHALAGQARGLTRVGLGLQALGSIAVPDHSFERQSAIVRFLDRETAQIDELIAKQEQLIALLMERSNVLGSEILQTDLHGSDTQIQIRRITSERDERVGHRSLPLLSVSIRTGVTRRDELTADLPKAENFSSYKRCLPGDIVLNRMRAFQGALGVAAIEGMVSPDYLVLKVESDIDPYWLAQWLKTPLKVGEMSSRLRGIGSTESGAIRTPRINKSDLGVILVPSISKRLQTQQVVEIDEVREGINVLIAKTTQMISLLKERRQALISAAVTGKIDVRGKA